MTYNTAHESSGEPDKVSAAEKPQKGYVVGQSITEKFKYDPIQTLTPMEMAQADFYQNCVFRSAAAGVAGGVMGVAFGIFMGAMEPASLSSPAPLADQPTKSAWQVFKGMVRTTGQRSSMYARSFGMIGLLYAGIECVIEDHRGRHDIYNSLYTGALTGGLLARGTGPTGMVMGAATFAGFSVVVDQYMGLH